MIVASFLTKEGFKYHLPLRLRDVKEIIPYMVLGGNGTVVDDNNPFSPILTVSDENISCESLTGKKAVKEAAASILKTELGAQVPWKRIPDDDAINVVVEYALVERNRLLMELATEAMSPSSLLLSMAVMARKIAFLQDILSATPQESGLDDVGEALLIRLIHREAFLASVISLLFPNADARTIPAKLGFTPTMNRREIVALLR